MSETLSAQGIVELYRAIHRRDPDPSLVERCLSRQVDLCSLLCDEIGSDEFRARLLRRHGFGPAALHVVLQHQPCRLT